jgi:hypothetical protein
METLSIGGIFLNAPSQMGISYPVLRIAIEDDQATIAVRPIQMPFDMADTTKNHTISEFLGLIRNSRVRELLDAAGKLK